MGNKCNTEMKILTFYDGEIEAIDAFADVIRYKIRQRIRNSKNLKITTGAGGNDFEGAYNMSCELLMAARKSNTPSSYVRVFHVE